jgi:N-acetylglucosamine kinase-like BadF-type ATPase
MILLADSGASKTDFALIKEGKVINTFKSVGLHPYQLSKERINHEIQENVIPNVIPDEVSRLLFFGSGCGSEHGKQLIHDAFAEHFQESDLLIEGDMMAAAIALFGESGSGVACILGTGSNACYFDKGRIINNMVSLGYLIGDEGSGNHIGRLFLQRAYYGELDADLLSEFENEFQLDRVGLIHKLYKEERVGKFLASVCEFVIKNKGRECLQRLIADSFDEFIDRHLMKLIPDDITEVSFVGSVAHYLPNELEFALQKRSFSLGKVVQHPMQEMINELTK